jgi:glycosyltransferase involved in cell wall biosynthesis
VTVTESQREVIVRAGIPAERVSVVPNAVDRPFFEAGAAPQDSAGPRTDGRFVVTYIGTIGMAHHLETLLEAAGQLRGDSRFLFRLVGEGACREALEAQARSLGLGNVEFCGQRPRGEVARCIAESSACAVLLRRNDVFRTVVPSKILEIMAVGRPILLGVEGEARALVERAGAGLAIEPENAAQLAAAIRDLAGDPERCRQFAENGRKFAAREFPREKLAERYLQLLARLAPSAAAAPLSAQQSCSPIPSIEEPG